MYGVVAVTNRRERPIMHAFAPQCISSEINGGIVISFFLLT